MNVAINNMLFIALQDLDRLLEVAMILKYVQIVTSKIYNFLY